MKKNSLLMVAALVMLMTSCTNRLTDFTVISTKSVPIGNQPTELKKADVRVKGVDKKHIVLFFPIGFPNLKEAIDKAIAQYPGAVALADGVVKSKYMHFLLYGQDSYIVEGTPLYPADLKSNDQTNSNSSVNGSVMRIVHQVNTEKNVTEVAKMYEVSVADVMKWNKLSNTSLKSGQELIIYIAR